MKHIILISICSMFLIACTSTQVTKKDLQESNASNYDAALAQKVGADDYGMKKFVIAFLKKGPNRNLSTEESKKLQRAHLDNISTLAAEGTLVLAGPFLDDGDLRGIYIFDVETIQEAEALTKTDPAIQTGSLMMELHPWYGSAATSLVGEWHSKIQKIEI